MKKDKVSIVWLRRDLRLHDQAALYHALRGKFPVLPLFIFDKNILNKLEERTDARVNFIHQTLQQLQHELELLDSSLVIKYNTPKLAWEQLLAEYDIQEVFTNHDYEPYARDRDKEINNLLASRHIPFYTFKDQCIFEKDEVVKDDGKPYTVFTPYSKKWKAKLSPFYMKSYPTEKYFSNFYHTKPLPGISLKEMNFSKSSIPFPPPQTTSGIIKNYKEQRDFPGVTGTSKLSVHFRFGTISIREKVRKAQQLSETWLNELIWREFYMQILWHFPYVATGAFKPAYNHIEWRNNPDEFERWCNGQTGYPIVDAGMRELNTTGFMHNRARMITASFLTKHLLIDWRWGEAYFAQKLLDFDLSANNGGWQWAAGCGTDAAPYFRVFNPALQTDKFDKDHRYIKKWVPEYNTPAYVKPVVEHSMARDRCLKAYTTALSPRHKTFGLFI
ncbi:MAG: DNA photolyase family protein [Bacteroidia bacterium]|nr:DNA photolyase family protein [Bacteroidia bacterium]